MDFFFSTEINLYIICQIIDRPIHGTQRQFSKQAHAIQDIKI